jgi:hypothetical protein
VKQISRVHIGVASFIALPKPPAPPDCSRRALHAVTADEIGVGV